MDIKAIETVYNGYRFRSRLEARWAVFFDAMGIKYLYEPQGFKFDDGTTYLPDFVIYGVRHRSWEDEYEPVIIEVKGVMAPIDEHKIKKMSEHMPVLVLGDIPKDSDEYLRKMDDDWRFHSFSYMDGDCYWATFSKYKGEAWICGPDHEQYDLGKSMDSALLKARQARFEHGEHGAVS